MKFLSLTVVEISLTKILERKKKEQTKGRTNEVSILNGCGDIFDGKSVTELRKDGRKDGRNHGQM